jgi:hypothetical protein
MPMPQTLQNMVVKLIVHFTTVFVFRKVQVGMGRPPQTAESNWQKNEYIKRKSYRAQPILNYEDKLKEIQCD